MTAGMCTVRGVQFAWTDEYLLTSGLDIDEWKARMNQRATRHMQLSLREAKRLVNPEFSESLWRDKNGLAIFDPATLSPPGQVRVPSGVLCAQNGGKIRPWATKMPHVPAPIHTEMFRLRFNALSVLYAATRLNLDIIPINTLTDRANIHNSYIQKEFRGERGNYRVTCDTCVVNYKCDYARKGAVCILPNSDAGVFAKMIGSRDTKEVLAGLRLMVTRNGERLEQAIEAEIPGEPTKEVTGLMNSVFNQAIQLAKLQDPSLRASPKIQIGITNGANGTVTVDGGGQPDNAQISTALKELQDYGIDLQDIDEKMLIDYLAAKSSGDMKQIANVVNQNQVIDAEEQPF
jgi:hypothetical protein